MFQAKYRLIAALLLSGLVCAGALGKPTQNARCNPDKMIASLKKDQALAKAMIAANNADYKIMGCNWDASMKAIKRGKLELYDLLRPHTDAGLSEALEIALDMSILFVPEQTLKRGRCVPGIIEPNLPDWMALLQSVSAKVKGVKSKKLAVQKKKCLEEINQALTRAKQGKLVGMKTFRQADTAHHRHVD
jgi:hypothetical protein